MGKLDKNLFIRVDAGTKIGTGHIMRCLTLADSLKKRFYKIIFISNQMPENLSSLIKNRGYEIHYIFGHTQTESQIRNQKYKKSIQNDIKQSAEIINSYRNIENWLIIDHYGIDQKWEKRIRDSVKKIIVIDDLANRKHDCDVLIDQNYHSNMKRRYEKLVSRKCLQLLGPKFALLRPEFKETRKKTRKKRKLQRILISFGGSDPMNQTSKVLRGIKDTDSEFIVDVIAGKANPHKKTIKKLCSSIPNVSFYPYIKNMAKIMLKADLAIGGGGSTTWERCCMGLPAVVSILSDNQCQITKEVARIGCVINLGLANSLKPVDYVNALKSLNPKKLQDMSKRCISLVDGKGTERVSRKIFQVE